jgi:maleylpyruvate isomerase
MDVAAVISAVASRTAAVVAALERLDEEELRAPSTLPDWSRLTVACHLRFGAEGFLRLTRSAITGEPAAFYPEGRARQRPSTLRPSPGEGPHAVVQSLAEHSATLQATWEAFDASQWEHLVTEPDDNRDLGPLPVAVIPLLRLTEIEVHGSDLDVGLDDWSTTFVSQTLPFRLGWLSSRRSNHRAVDETLVGSWLLRASDGPIHLVSVSPDGVESHPAEDDTPSTAVIDGTSRDLLALLLGRPLRQPLEISGDREFGASFSRAFPGP